MRNLTLLLGWLVTLTACSAVITPNLDGGGELVDGGDEPPPIPDGYSTPDLIPRAASNGRACTTTFGIECGPGAACADNGVRRIGMLNEGRLLSFSCVDSVTSMRVRLCALDGNSQGYRPGFVCYGFQGTGAGSGLLLTVRDCLRLREEALRQVRPGEMVGDCWFSDQTRARRVAPLPLGGCALTPPRRGCGVGCDNCDASLGLHCLFASETYPTGVCTPVSSVPMARFLPCQTENPRRACARGQVCLLPIRRDAEGLPDRERRGMCLPPADCIRYASDLSDGYICDTTLVQ